MIVKKLVVVPLFKRINGIAQANTGRLDWNQSQGKLWKDLHET